MVELLTTYSIRSKVKSILEEDALRSSLSKRDLDKTFSMRPVHTQRNDFTIVYNGKLCLIQHAIQSKRVAANEEVDIYIAGSIYQHAIRSY